MEFNWSKNNLEKLKQDYINLKKENKFQNRKKINQELKMIYEMENILNSSEKSFIFLTAIKYIDSSKFLPKTTLTNYLNIPDFIRKWILNASKILHNFEDNFNSKSSLKMNLTDQELVELSYDFFNWLNKYTLQINNFLNPKQKLLKIIHSKTYSNYSGVTYPFHYPSYQAYILLKRENTIIDFITLNHELAHGIYFEKHSEYFLNYSYLTELEGSFFEFLSLEFLKSHKIITPDIISELDYHFTINGIENIIDFYFVYAAIMTYKSTKKIKIEDITLKLLKHDLPFFINESILSNTLQNNPKNIAKYALSYLVSLDLEKLYLKDPELAFHELEAIRHNFSLSLKNLLINHHITFMEDYYTNLKEKLTTLQLIKK